MLWDALHLPAAAGAGARPETLWTLAVPAEAVDASSPCPDVDALFRGLDDQHTALVVEDPRTGATGLLVRWRFERLMSGRFGFGRALHQRTPVGAVTDWAPALLTRDTALEGAVAVMLERHGDRRHDDLLMRGEGGWRRLSAGTLLEVLAAQMARRASRDELTGLANRTALLEHLHRACRPDGPAPAPAGLVFIDLDGLKTVNDLMGHVAGDALIVSTARRLAAGTAPGDLLARLGGDEFVVALGPAPAGAAAARVGAAARRLLAAVRRPDPGLDPRTTSTASVGAVVASPGMRAEDLLREADLAMYRAKRAGGDRVEVVGGARLGPGPAAGLTDLSFRRALAEDELVLHHQPIVGAADGRVWSTESLVRWQHPRHGLLGADVVLAAAGAERSTLALDLWVMAASARRLVAWDAQLPAPPPLMNVNVSPAGLEDPDLAELVLGVLQEAGCPPGRLRLELPETASAALARSAVRQLDVLRAAGVALTLDDVGTGSASLSHVSSLAVRGMKIDRSFVARMLTDHRSEAVIRMLVGLGGELDLTVTAEGVESAEQWTRLRELGVGFVQGYGVARPASAERVSAWLLAHDPAGPGAPGAGWVGLDA